MNWQTINSQRDLEALAQSACWADTSSFAYAALDGDQPYYPSDVCRDGHHRKNLHILCSADSAEGMFLELVFIQAEKFTDHFLDNPFIQGRVDSLLRVIIPDTSGRTAMQCARLIYRYSSKRPELPKYKDEN